MECPHEIYLYKYGITVPCGKCGACIKRKISDWSIRCRVESKASFASYFVTLTYSVNPYVLEKKDVQKFFKRLRKDGACFSYFALGDYGDTFGRPHYHLLLFLKKDYDVSRIQARWNNGFVDVRPLKAAGITYVVQYGFLARLDWQKNDARPSPFFLFSKKPAIGMQYLSPNKLKFHRQGDIQYFPDAQYKRALPRYYRGKIFRKNKYLAELDKDRLLRERLQRRDDVLREFSKQTSNPQYMYYDRLTTSAQQYLDKLRARKGEKKKIIHLKL